MPQPTSPCDHAAVICLNEHEIIRKYRCLACAEVMMCCCDEIFGRKFLSHQLSEGSELKSRRRIKVTIGFQPTVCNECRGLPAVAAPAAEGYGLTTKTKRFYWREIFFAETERITAWNNENQAASEEDRAIAHREIRKQVLVDISTRHKISPKYDFSESSQADVITAYNVKVRNIAAEYVSDGKKGALIRHKDTVISPEAYASQVLQEEGWSVMVLESVPLHCLFGVMMWMLIQDPADPACVMSGFGNRNAFEDKSAPSIIWTALPEDFGSEGYAERRSEAIEKHLKRFPDDRDELLWTFDLWAEHSTNLRQYLWAHREYDLIRARRLIEILPPAAIVAILRYLVADYWSRYLGWPDLLAWKNDNILLAEVKSSSDKLSQDQKQWLSGNHDYLKLPFVLIKLHRVR